MLVLSMGQIIIKKCFKYTFYTVGRLVNCLKHYVIKFISDLRQVGGFLRVLLFPPPMILTATI